jgi:hypothetical protein
VVSFLDVGEVLYFLEIVQEMPEGRVRAAVMPTFCDVGRAVQKELCILVD